MTSINNMLSWLKHSQNKNRVFYLFLSAVLALFWAACDNPDIYNLNSGIPQQKYETRTTESFEVFLQTVKEDSFRTDEFTKDLLGCYKDNIIGRVRSCLFTELQLPVDEISFDTNATMDSIVFYLRYYGKKEYFGFPTIKQKFHVYQVSQRIYKDSVYYSNRKIAYDPVEIGSFEGSFSPTDSTTLRIKLNDFFGKKIMNATADQLNKPEDFAAFLNGIAIVPEETAYLGAIMYFKLSDTKTCLKLYYNSTKTVTFPVNSFSARITTFDYDYSGSAVGQQLAQPAKSFESVFLQPLSGVKVRVTIPSLKGMLDSGQVVIHKAELVFPIDENSPYLSYLPSYLLVLNNDSLGKNQNIVDRYERYYNSAYDNIKKEYRFGVARQVQYELMKYNADTNFKGFYGFNLLIPNDNFNLNTTGYPTYLINAAPVIIRQSEGGRKKVKLLITYSKINKN